MPANPPRTAPEEELVDADAGPLLGDSPDPAGLDDSPAGGPLEATLVRDPASQERGLLDDTASHELEVPSALMPSEERGLLEDSDEPSDSGDATDVEEGSLEAPDDGAEGIDETFELDESVHDRVLDREVDTGFDEARFAGPTAREPRRWADRGFGRLDSAPAHPPFVSGPPVADPPSQCTASLVAFGIEVCALHEPGATTLALLREGVPEVVADLGEPDDDPGPVARLRARVRDGALEVLVEGGFGAWVYREARR